MGNCQYIGIWKIGVTFVKNYTQTFKVELNQHSGTHIQINGDWQIVQINQSNILKKM